MRPRLVVDPETIEEDHIHVVAAIVWRRSKPGQFLIAQRQQGKHLENFWELPGGKIESGESPWHALRREIAEEISIEVHQARPYMRVYYRYTERNVLLDTWWVDDYRGEVMPMERQLLEWIGIDQIGLYRFPPADIPILDAIKCSATA